MSAAARAPFISVVVPTVTGGARLVRCVRSVLACDYERLEVIVVDNRPAASGARTLLAGQFGADPRVRYAPETRPGSGYARNKGLELAAAELVAFADDDTVVDPGWLSAIAGAFDENVGCVTGLILPLSIETPMQALFEQFAGFGKGSEPRSFRIAESADDPLFPYAAGTFGSGANTALRKSVALELGGFDVRLGAGTPACGGEELDLYIRLLLAGEQLCYTPAAVVFHEHPADGRGLRCRVFNYGVGLTATLTSRLLAGPRMPLLRAAPAGVGHLLSPSSRKNAPRGSDYPVTLTMLERLGMLVGPLAYVLSTLRMRKLSRGPRPGETPFVPAAIAVLELEDGLRDLELGPSPEGGEYGALLALVRMHGDPLATIEVAAEHGRITAEALAAAIWAGAGTQLQSHAHAHRCVELEQLSPKALTSGVRAQKLCGSPRVDQIEPPFVSLIVPTRGRPERIETCLASLRQLRYPSLEILVVDNAPEDRRTRSVLETCSREDERVRYVAEPLPGSSVARNRGIREAAGEILAFTDDDVVLDADWLHWMVEPFVTDGRVGVVTGLVLPARLETFEQRWFEEVSGFGKGFEPRVFDLDEHRAHERLLYPYWGGVFGSGNSMAFRRDVLERIGGFDPALGAGSRALSGADVESFSHAIIAGSRLAYEPRAVCWHDHRADPAAMDRQMFSYGVGLTAILTKWLLRDPRLAKTMLRQLARFPLALLRAPRSSSPVPHELSRLGKQLHMNKRRNTLGLQVRGYCLGPILYLRSVMWARRLRLHAVLSSEGAGDE
jgi:GT2 family glycosyltransferase